MKAQKLLRTIGAAGLMITLLANCSPTEEINALKQRTLDNLVFVKGGTFMMGDVGYEDESGQFRNFGPDADAFRHGVGSGIHLRTVCPCQYPAGQGHLA